MMPKNKPDRSEVTGFDHSQLKHVIITEKTVLPSSEGKYTELVPDYILTSLFGVVFVEISFQY